MTAQDKIHKLQARLLNEIDKERKFIEESFGILKKASQEARAKKTRRRRLKRK
jgi:hypothetical protein